MGDMSVDSKYDMPGNVDDDQKLLRDFRGRRISADCGKNGYYQGLLRNIKSDQIIELDKPLKDGVPLDVSFISLSVDKIKDLKVIEHQKSNKYGDFRHFTEPQIPSPPCRLSFTKRNASYGPSGIPLLDASNGYSSGKCYNAAFNEPIDFKLLNTDYDFDGNLAIFKRSMSEEFLSSKDELQLVKRNFRNDENVLNDPSRVISWVGSSAGTEVRKDALPAKTSETGDSGISSKETEVQEFLRDCRGYRISADCGKNGYYQGLLRNIKSDQIIELDKPLKDGVPLDVSFISLSVDKIKDLKVIEHQKSNKYGDFRHFTEPQVPSPPCRLSFTKRNASYGPSGIPLLDASNGYSSGKCYNAALNEPIDFKLLNTDYDFDGNLAIFKRSMSEEFLSSKDELQLVKRNFRNDENVLNDPSRVISWVGSSAGTEVRKDALPAKTSETGDSGISSKETEVQAFLRDCRGHRISADCGKNGYYQGLLRNIKSDQIIELDKPLKDGVPLDVSCISLSVDKIKDLKVENCLTVGETLTK